MSVPMQLPTKAVSTVTNLYAAITGDDTVVMINRQGDKSFGGPGIEAGGRIALGTATTVDVSVVDADGKVLYSPAVSVTADTDIDPIPTGIRGPLTVVTTNISNAAHTLTVTWAVKK